MPVFHIYSLQVYCTQCSVQIIRNLFAMVHNLLGLIVLKFILGSGSGTSVMKSSDPKKCIVATDDALAFSPCTLGVHMNNIIELKAKM